jgi:Flp pilus assembly protein protease CpaA
MDTISISALIWLSVVSWFDIRTRQIPHSAWVAIPFLIGSVYRVVNGGWELSLLAFVVVLASERRYLSGFRYFESLGTIYSWFPIIGGCAYLAGATNLIGTLAIIGFWIAWELHCWGGADAMASIALLLCWPDLPFVLAFLMANSLAASISTMISLIQDRKFRLHQIPGLPLLLLSVVGRVLIIVFSRT